MPVKLWSAWMILAVFCTMNLGCAASAQSAPTLPDRPDGAMTGSELKVLLEGLSREAREERIFQEARLGNIPDFLRTFVPVSVTKTIDGQSTTAIFRVSPDYVALGTNEDYFLMPMSPLLAQRIADISGCVMPTREMVNEIHTAADVKLQPQPIPPSPAMTTIPVFWDHNNTVLGQREMNPAPLGALVAGHKKDVVITPLLGVPDNSDNVAIYGWHYTNGSPIQPLYLGHGDFYADYSHGIRLVDREVLVNGEPMDIAEIWADTELWELLSDESPSQIDRYDVPLPSDVITIR